MNELISAVNGLSAGWGAAIWRASWHGAIVFAVVWAVGRLWPRTPPSVHNWLWRLAFLRLVLGVFPVGGLGLPVLPPAISSLPPSASAPAASSLAVPGHAMLQESFPGPALETTVLPSLVAALVVLWVLGVGCCLLLAARSLLRGRQLRLGCASWPGEELSRYLSTLCQDNGVPCPPALMVAEIASPLIVGIRKPWIVLPRSLEQSHSVVQTRLMLAHEVAHLKRRDLWWSWLPLLAQGLFFFHPAVWLGRREWLLSQEMACDELALRMTGASNYEYGQMLIRVAARSAVPPQALLASGITESYHLLNRRLSAMWHRVPLSRRRTLAVNLAMLALGVGLLVPWRLTAQADQAPDRSLASVSSRSVTPDPWDRLEELAGSIVTPDGVPIPGAKIRLVVYDNDRSESVVIASTLSDARGRFAFREPGRLLGQYSRPLTVVAQARGWGLSLQSIFHAQEKVEITAMPRTRLVVTLTDANGKPAQGVQATISMLTTKGLPGAHLIVPAEVRSELASESNAQGICEFEGLPQEGTARVRIEDERFAQPVGHRDLALGTLGPDEFRLRVKDSSIIFGCHIPLTPGLTISGRAVYESTGKPAAGIRVGAEQRPSVDVPHALGGGSAVTDSEGRYTVKQLVPGRYNIALDLRGELNRSWTAVAHEDVILNHGDHLKGVDFALIPGAVIAGQVTGQETGAPIAGVLVGVYGPAHPRSTGWVQNTKTAADGSYFLRVPAGKQHLYLQGKWPAGFSSPKQRSHDVELEDGDTRRVDFALPGAPLKPIHGRVLGPDGKPVPGAEVIVLPSWRIIETGAEGEFALEPAKVKLRARQGNLATERAGKPSTEGEVVLRLKEDILASVTGLVTDATEKPVTDAHVCLFVSVYGQWLLMGDGVRTDAEGRYRFASLWSHQIYQVAVRQKSEDRQPGSDTTFELGTGEIRELPTLRAAAAAPRG